MDVADHMTRFDLWSRCVARSKRPIFVGPWREEIGSEVLYFLPWLSAWRARYGIKADRLVAISRGGASHWYGVGKSVELYDYWPPETLRIESLRTVQAGQSVKPQGISALEQALYQTVSARLGISRFHVLHPSAMYHHIGEWMAERMSLHEVMQHLRFDKIPTPQLPITAKLPEKFACVRFYGRATWPLSEEIRDYCANIVGSLAKSMPVVVLGSSLHLDDHMDLLFEGPNVTSLLDAFPLREGLALQSAVIARSALFVGTYGGMMQLALRLGKPSVGFYLNFKGTAFAHKALSEWLALKQNTPIFIGTPTQGELVRSVISVPLEAPQSVASSSGVLG